MGNPDGTGHRCPVTLTPPQREAVRRALVTFAGDTGDLGLSLDEADRPETMRLLAKVHAVVGALDLIGWAEQLDAPELQPVTPTREQARWLTARADELAACLTAEAWQADRDADELAIETMRRLGADR